MNNNRIIVNAMVSQQHNIKKKRDVVSTSKLIHFYKYESEISLDQGRSFVVNKRGQIMELNLNLVNSKQKDENLCFYIKNIEKIMNIP